MSSENDTWIMHGMSWDDPLRIRSWQELVNWIDEVGFLPLFHSEIEGFSVEEHTSDLFWWTGDPEQDPWTWREIIARTGRVAYGKFFGGRAGFISREWLPVFANYRRDGYDFDTLWEEGLANSRSKKIMDVLEQYPQIPSPELKKLAGFGKGGEKNFDGIVTELQMRGFLTVCDFRRKISKAGLEYGMPVGVYTTPEALWGYDAVTADYRSDPDTSREKAWCKIASHFPEASEEKLKKVMK